MGRLSLHDILCQILGNKYCYFTQPADIELQYPCIIYSYTNDQDIFADNLPYISHRRYTVTIIDEDPDSKIPKRLKELLLCSSDRNFETEGLSHFVYTVYFNGPRISENKEETENGKT